MISIITITYNDFVGLKKTLSSIYDLSDVESVVINGGTDIESLTMLKSYKGKVINEKDDGIADAFNKGIANSSGEAILFLNSGDELIDQTYISDGEEILKKNKSIDFIHSNLLLYDSNGTELFMRPSFCNLGRGLPYLHPTMIVRKSVFDKIGVFNKNYKIAMDFDLVARLVKNRFEGFYVKDKLVVRMDGSGISIEKEFEAIKECYRSLRDNNLFNIKNIFGMFIRITLFSLRKLMIVIGLESLLTRMKKKKHAFGKAN